MEAAASDNAQAPRPSSPEFTIEDMKKLVAAGDMKEAVGRFSQKAGDVMENWQEGAATGQRPNDGYVTYVLLALVTLACFYGIYVRHLKPSGVKTALRGAGVNLRRITKAAKEIDRKMFHLAGLLIPLLYQILLDMGATQEDCATVCMILTGAGWLFDITRILSPSVQRAFLRTPIGRIMREKEHKQLTGACYFSAGCTIVVSLFPPAVAMTAILFLILGDMSAAIMGRSFGGETVALKLGRDGKKSVEGSVAMFVVCFVIGTVMFAGVHLREYAVFCAAVTATAVEAYEPFGLNDNLTIPLLSALTLFWGFQRTLNCG